MFSWSPCHLKIIHASFCHYILLFCSWRKIDCADMLFLRTHQLELVQHCSMQRTFLVSSSPQSCWSMCPTSSKVIWPTMLNTAELLWNLYLNIKIYFTMCTVQCYYYLVKKASTPDGTSLGTACSLDTCDDNLSYCQDRMEPSSKKRQR